MNPKKLFLSSFSFGENEGVPEEGAVSASMTLSVSEQRKSSRRVRNSFNKNGRPFSGSKGLGYMQLRAANAPLLNREESVVEAKSSVSSVILESLAKTNMCDLELIGCDKLPVLAPSYLLACHSVVLEDMFYPKSDAAPKEMSTVPGSGVDECKERAAPESMNPVYTSIYPRKVELAFASQDAVRGLVHYCATNTLPISMENGSSDNVRSVYQCYLMGQLFKMRPLMEEANRILRRLVNKNPRLVCAAFDEYIILTRRAALEDNWGFYSGLDSCSLASHSHDNLNKYMLEYLRESPVETLLGGGVALLSPVSIEVIIQDQSMDVDETTMFHILSAWVKAAPIDNNVEVGKSLVSHIKLSLIQPEYLNNQVKKCGFVDLKYVQDAQEEIQLMLANQSIDDKERVIIENAGHTVVNGTYVRMEEDIGLGDEEIVFVREAEDELDQDLGLYLWNGQWAISSCVDYSNIFYTCGVLDTKKTCSSRLKPPKSGWKPVSGCEPPPICTWKPGKGDNKSKLAESRLAPTLDELKGSTSKSIVPAISDVAKGDHAEYTNLTLSEMMNLPTDEEFECFDYEFEGDDEVEAHLGGNQKRDRRMLLSRAAGSAAGGRRISVEET